ncbi:hypothetical protein GOODEAATRI_001067 [Goodea atripinnis]|uniref:Uncharacterized protein n=1 Tax=Goodea atripinnis TaxID=208336 RepID=A0ABV0N6W8_9TELE
MTEQSDLTESGAHLQSAISNQAQPTVGAAFTAPSTPTLALFSEEIGKWVFCIQCTLKSSNKHSHPVSVSRRQQRHYGHSNQQVLPHRCGVSESNHQGYLRSWNLQGGVSSLLPQCDYTPGNPWLLFLVLFNWNSDTRHS